MQSSRWQAIARVPEETFVKHIEDTKSKGEELTTASVLKIAKPEIHKTAETPAHTINASSACSPDRNTSHAHAQERGEVVSLRPPFLPSITID